MDYLQEKILIFDGLSMKTRIAEFPMKNKRCRVCGDGPDIKNIKDNAERYTFSVCGLQ